MVDVLHLYLETAESSLRGSFGPVARIAGLSITEKASEIQEEIGVLSRIDTTPESLNRDSSLYAMKVDLQQAVEQGKDELSHYPGGIIIKNRFGDDRDKYCFLLTNRQQSDDGKPVAKAFREVGLPVISNIKE